MLCMSISLYIFYISHKSRVKTKHCKVVNNIFLRTNQMITFVIFFCNRTANLIYGWIRLHQNVKPITKYKIPL